MLFFPHHRDRYIFQDDCSSIFCASRLYSATNDVLYPPLTLIMQLCLNSLTQVVPVQILFQQGVLDQRDRRTLFVAGDNDHEAFPIFQEAAVDGAIDLGVARQVAGISTRIDSTCMNTLFSGAVYSRADGSVRSHQFFQQTCRN